MRIKYKWVEEKISKKNNENEVKITYTDDMIKERLGKYGAVYL